MQTPFCLCFHLIRSPCFLSGYFRDHYNDERVAGLWKTSAAGQGRSGGGRRFAISNSQSQSEQAKLPMYVTKTISSLINFDRSHFCARSRWRNPCAGWSDFPPPGRELQISLRRDAGGGRERENLADSLPFHLIIADLKNISDSRLINGWPPAAPRTIRRWFNLTTGTFSANRHPRNAADLRTRRHQQHCSYNDLLTKV